MNYMIIVKIVAAILIAALIMGRKKFFKAIPSACYIYIIAWLLVGLFYACAWVCHILFAFIDVDVSWEHYVSENRWIIQGVIYGLLVIVGLMDSSSTSRKADSHKSMRFAATLSSGVAAASKNKYNNNTNTSKTNKNVNVNINDIKNKVASGISVRLDWSKLGAFDKDKIIELAKTSGASITFTNIANVQNRQTIENMAMYASKAPGQVKYETPVEASFDALRLAKSGACFVCDNSKGSSLVSQIVQAATERNGHVTFINCSKRSQDELQSLKKQYGRYMDFS